MNKLIVSSSPHIKTKHDTPSIMLDVIIALLPALIAGTVIYGIRALLVVATCVLTSVVSEYLFNIIVKKDQTIFDLSAVVTGLILGLNLHANAPVWQCIVGSVFAIIVVKCLFGGLGCNFANPAITARVFLLICFSSTLAGGALPLISSDPDLVSGATPLAILAGGKGELPSLLDMFLGLRGGAIGESCILALLLGFVYLVARGVIKFEVPVAMVGTVFVLSLLVNGNITTALYHVLSGGLVFAAIFMATDYVTTPATRLGKSIFAIGAGLMTFLIRTYGNYPEGASFGILFMNILSPYIESWIKPKAFTKKGNLLIFGRDLADLLVCEICCVSFALIVNCVAFFSYFATPVLPIVIIVLLVAVSVYAIYRRNVFLVNNGYKVEKGGNE